MNYTQEYLGQTALVTGAGRGIGLGIAQRLAEQGAHVVLSDLNIEKGERAADELRKRRLSVDFVAADLSIPGGGQAMVSNAVRLTGKVDVLINNARAGRRLELLEETEENWDQALAVGLKAAFFASQATIRLMADRGGCRIVNVSSVAAIQATFQSPSYHAAKSALMHLTRYLAVAGGPFRANVNCVLPGLIVQEEHRQRYDSDVNAPYRSMAQNYQPLGQVGAEKDIAEAVLYLCSDRARYVSGACLTLDGAATAQEPFSLLIRQSTCNKSA